LDTVWPAGTTRRWPFSVSDGRATGPGVFDMKAGLVQGLYALSSVSCPTEITLLITTDEEIGSPTSRPLIEHEARNARAVLVLEPSANGAFKTARKGISMYELTVEGRAAHPGLDPEHGVNAIVELARQVPRVVDLAHEQAGTTVVPTTVAAGTTRNTIPARATMAIDVRAWTAAEQRRVHEALLAVRPDNPLASISLSGGINRPPLEEARSQALAELADECIAELHVRPAGRARVGGGSDGNFTAALGVPTLDGMGAVGGHAHAEGEYVDVTYLAERAALVRAVVEKIQGNHPKDVAELRPTREAVT
jgi:glutamate carboxypeptidase